MVKFKETKDSESVKLDKSLNGKMNLFLMTFYDKSFNACNNDGLTQMVTFSSFALLIVHIFDFVVA